MCKCSINLTQGNIISQESLLSASYYCTQLPFLQKFDPEFIPAVKIDRNFSMKHSVTQESIIASLEHTTSAQAGEHVLCTDHDAERESKISCKMSNNNIAHDHKVIQSNETTDSGIMLSSGQNSSNYQEANVSPACAHTGGLVEYSSSTSSSDLSEHAAQLQDTHDESQEHNEQALVQPTVSGANPVSSSLNSLAAESGYVTKPRNAKCTALYESQDHNTEHCQALVHPSGTNAAFNSQTVGWTSFDSSHATESQGQITAVNFGTLEPLTNGTCTDEYVHEHAQTSIMISSSSSISPELDKMNGLLSISSESLSCFLDIDTTLTLDDITNDHLNANADLIGCNINANDCASQLLMPSESIRSVEQYYREQQAPMCTIDQAENSLYQAHGEMITTGITNNMALAHMTGMGGSSLSLMCDTEY